jgi:hypothetical protein
MLNGIHRYNHIFPHLECIKLPAHFKVDTDVHSSYQWTKLYKVATSSQSLVPKLAVHGTLRMYWTLQTTFTWILTFDYMTLCYLEHDILSQQCLQSSLSTLFPACAPMFSSSQTWSTPIYHLVASLKTWPLVVFSNQPYATHTLMTMGVIVSIVFIVCGAQQYTPCCRHAHYAFLCCLFDPLRCWMCGYPQMMSVICIQSVSALHDNVISTWPSMGE